MFWRDSERNTLLVCKYGLTCSKLPQPHRGKLVPLLEGQNTRVIMPGIWWLTFHHFALSVVDLSITAKAESAYLGLHKDNENRKRYKTKHAGCVADCVWYMVAFVFNFD